MTKKNLLVSTKLNVKCKIAFSKKFSYVQINFYLPYHKLRVQATNQSKYKKPYTNAM